MEEQTKDMPKEAYQYGYAHGIEDVQKLLKIILKEHILNNSDNLNCSEYQEVVKTVLNEMIELLSEFASDVKAKELADYKV